MASADLMVHQPEDSIKADISTALMAIVRDLPAAHRKLKTVMGLVAERQAFGMRVIRRTLGLGPR